MGSTFVHTPKGLFDLGDAGRHPITLSAAITTESGNRFDTPQIEIMSAIVSLASWGREQFLDVLHLVNQTPETRAGWEMMLLAEYRMMQEKSKRLAREKMSVVATQ